MTGENTPPDCPALLRTRSGFTAVVSGIDERAITDARHAARVAEAWVTWLRSLRWSHFATGTFERPVNGSTALRVVRSWIGGVTEAYAAVGLQRGPVTLTHHVHLLIGGIHRHGLPESHLRGSWVRDGHVRIEPFTPTRGGVEYLVKQAEVIELLGDPQPYRPRRRGRRGG